jgi:hypothetical protein
VLVLHSRKLFGAYSRLIEDHAMQKLASFYQDIHLFLKRINKSCTEITNVLKSLTNEKMHDLLNHLKVIESFAKRQVQLCCNFTLASFCTFPPVESCFTIKTCLIVINGQLIMMQIYCSSTSQRSFDERQTWNKQLLHYNCTWQGKVPDIAEGQRSSKR